MNRDLSWELHDRYFNLSDRKIELVLKSGRVLRGMIIGYFTDGIDNGNARISKWHFLEEKARDNDLYFNGIDVLGNMRGEVIRQKEIREVRFLEDGSILVFTGYRGKTTE